MKRYVKRYIIFFCLLAVGSISEAAAEGFGLSSRQVAQLQQEFLSVGIHGSPAFDQARADEILKTLRKVKKYGHIANQLELEQRRSKPTPPAFPLPAPVQPARLPAQPPRPSEVANLQRIIEQMQYQQALKQSELEHLKQENQQLQQRLIGMQTAEPQERKAFQTQLAQNEVLLNRYQDRIASLNQQNNLFREQIGRQGDQGKAVQDLIAKLQVSDQGLRQAKEVVRNLHIENDALNKALNVIQQKNEKLKQLQGKRGELGQKELAESQRENQRLIEELLREVQEAKRGEELAEARAQANFEKAYEGLNAQYEQEKDKLSKELQESHKAVLGKVKEAAFKTVKNEIDKAKQEALRQQELEKQQLEKQFQQAQAAAAVREENLRDEVLRQQQARQGEVEKLQQELREALSQQQEALQQQELEKQQLEKQFQQAQAAAAVREENLRDEVLRQQQARQGEVEKLQQELREALSQQQEALQQQELELENQLKYDRERLAELAEEEQAKREALVRGFEEEKWGLNEKYKQLQKAAQKELEELRVKHQIQLDKCEHNALKAAQETVKLDRERLEDKIKELEEKVHMLQAREEAMRIKI